MRTELEEALAGDFHGIYVLSDLQDGGSRCGDGWEPIIRHMLEQFEVSGINPKLLQIKEKFGTLCVYSHQPYTEYSPIDVAEKLSSITCETCGKQGRTVNVTKYHIKTLCTMCLEGLKTR